MNRSVKFLVLGLIGIFLTAPAVAEHRHTSSVEFVRAAGCDAIVVTSDQESPINSFYAPGVSVLYIGTADEGLPDYVVTTVLAHETGHCLQDQSGSLLEDRLAVDIELEADMLAAEILCRLGHDGARMVHDTFVWAHEEFGYNGDASHGSLDQRIAAGLSAPACGVPSGDQTP